jgi:hypothetical protein
VIEIYVGQFSAGWAVDGQTQGWSAHATPLAGLERWIGEIEARHAHRWRKARVDLWLSGGLARPFVCGPVAGLRGWRDAETVAASAAAEATGLGGACQVRLEDWPGEEPALATALDASLVEAIENFETSRRIRWRSVRPRWAAALDERLAQRPSPRLFALAEEDALTVLCAARDSTDEVGNVQLASTYAPPPNKEDARALMNRLVLSNEAQPDDVWFVSLEGGEPAAPAQAAGGRRPGWPGLTPCMERLDP